MIEYSKSAGIATVRLNNPPLNAIGFELLEELTAAVSRANADQDVRGIIVTGIDEHFSAGADVNIFKEIASADDAIRTSRIFQEAFDAVENSRKPCAAAMAGNVIGGALELAMACHFRVCTRRTKFSFPEVTLGINPGAGGTQRLPRLIGVEAALKMILTGKPIKADEALELGLVDRVCEADELIETAYELLQSGKRPTVTSQRTDKISDIAANDEAFRQAQQLIEKARPEIIAPKKVSDAVRMGIDDSCQAGLKAEQEGFAECMETLAARNKIYLFFAARQTNKIPELDAAAAMNIAATAVVGTGSMGTGIAQAFAASGLPVVITDAEKEAVEKALARIGNSLERRIQQGKMSRQRAEEVLGRISRAKDWNDIGKADLVVEAVFEDVAVKCGVMSQIEAVCRSDAIIASNTSTIDLDILAECLNHPQRLTGLHFFNPAHAMPLVEVIRRVDTDAGVIATAMKLVKDIRKTPILVKNRAGFVVNRLFIPYLKEAFQLLEDGAEPRVIDATMVDFGFSMGPLTLIDMAGIDILALTDKQMCSAFSYHLPLSQVALSLVERGCLGQKTGAGVYTYRQGDYTPQDSDLTRSIIADVQMQAGKAAREIDAAEVTDRLIMRMAAEAFRVVEEQIAQRESDIDVAMVLGTGFPDFRGGVLKYAYDLGINEVIHRLESLVGRFGERFQPCRLLKERAGV
ncbi:MAG: enoyl-CoA hydratase/isomerase family protein [Sedimentisphaerales bacterium]|nr:enoyl-CoA hydratase/isomerase family protein [Sedimentisphaerales bacterium]